MMQDENSDMGGALTQALAGGDMADSTPGAVNIPADAVAIDGVTPQVGERFTAQVEWEVVAENPDGSISCTASKINDMPVDGSDENAPAPDDASDPTAMPA